MACALALLIAGCATTPVDELERPAFEMPERCARDGDIPMRADWWQTFDDPALDRLVDRALSNNFTLRSAYARVEQARATLAAEGAALFPSVDASAEQSATRRSSGDSVSTSVAGDDFDLDQDRSNWSDTRSLQFSASYELDLWGGCATAAKRRRSTPAPRTRPSRRPRSRSPATWPAAGISIRSCASASRCWKARSRPTRTCST